MLAAFHGIPPRYEIARIDIARPVADTPSRNEAVEAMPKIERHFIFVNVIESKNSDGILIHLHEDRSLEGFHFPAGRRVVPAFLDELRRNADLEVNLFA